MSGFEYEKRDLVNYTDQNEEERASGRTWDEIREERRRQQHLFAKEKRRF